MRLSPLLPLVCLALLASACGPRSLVDGGWEGSLECNGVTLDVEAMFDHDTDSDEVVGWFYIERNIDFGILGNLRTTERAEIEDGEFDVQDLRVTGELNPTDADDGENTARATFDVEIDPDRVDEMKGDFDRLDGNGASVLTCDLELDQLTDPEN
jgi:hypothetical protein